MTTTNRHDAARARRDRPHAQPWDRPKDRRNAIEQAGSNRTLVRAALTIRADSGSTGTAHFTGIASTYEQPYEMWDIFGPYTEVVSLGAGAKSLATNPDVELNIGHDSNRRLARTTSTVSPLILRETTTGLEVEAPSLNLADDDVRQAVRKIEDGLFDQMSFKFRIEKGSWSPDYTEYRIEQYDIDRGDVSIVGYGANPHTTIELRSPKTWAELIDPDETRALLYV